MISKGPVWGASLALGLDSESSEPLFLQVARGLTEAIRGGRLGRGTRLPGTRQLASELEVHRNTVIRAYAELEQEGWIEMRPRSGAFVSTSLPELPLRRSRRTEPLARASTPGFDWSALPPRALEVPRNVELDLGGGIPDPRLFPERELGRALRRALLSDAARVLAYGHPEGHPRLRSALAELVAKSRGISASADEILVTRGSQMALYLLAKVLLEPGDAVAVEALGYPPAWNAFRARGATLVPVPVDAHGLDVAFLENALERRTIRAVYVTPHHQFPTMATLSAPRRLALLALARKRRFAVIEDDYDHEFHFEGRPILPLANRDPDRVVVYVGTLSKSVAPGLRTGWVVAPRSIVEAMARSREEVDRQGDLLLEAAVAELLEDGVIQRHARKARRVYAARRALAAELWERALGHALSFELASGGLAIWGRVKGVDAERWARAALSLGVLVSPGRRYAFDGRPLRALRLGFANLDDRRLREAVRRLSLALESARSR
ncbi:MAG: PLP-dependent aminotransferase family protein [Polyangiaceae bacterium]